MACGGGYGWQHGGEKKKGLLLMANGSAYTDTLSKNFSSHDLYLKITKTN